MSELVSRIFPKPGEIFLRRPSLAFLLGFMAILLAISLFFVWSRLQFVNLEYSISSNEAKVRELRQEVARMRLEAASLRSPGRIERIAHTRLGLRLPSHEQVITVD